MCLETVRQRFFLQLHPDLGWGGARIEQPLWPARGRPAPHPSARRGTSAPFRASVKGDFGPSLCYLVSSLGGQIYFETVAFGGKGEMTLACFVFVAQKLLQKRIYESRESGVKPFSNWDVLYLGSPQNLKGWGAFPEPFFSLRKVETYFLINI